MHFRQAPYQLNCTPSLATTGFLNNHLCIRIDSNFCTVLFWKGQLVVDTKMYYFSPVFKIWLSYTCLSSFNTKDKEGSYANFEFEKIVNINWFLPTYLLQGSKIQTRVGLLMLLCTWLSNCPIAVTHFLHNSANVPFVSFAKLWYIVCK